jgi:hypothetical protein
LAEGAGDRGGRGCDRRRLGSGVTAGQFDELINAIRDGSTDVNVHSSLYQGGEIRAQLGEHVH